MHSSQLRGTLRCPSETRLLDHVSMVVVRLAASSDSKLIRARGRWSAPVRTLRAAGPEHRVPLGHARWQVNVIKLSRVMGGARHDHA